jgi:23S rRNA pseudouridine1911/1915/1917 synthase
MIRNRTIVVEPDAGEMRLDLFLLQKVATTNRSLAAAAIERDLVLVNGRPSKKGDKLAAGDQVTVVEMMELCDWKAVGNPAVKVPVLHEEKSFLVIDKPAGMAMHPLHPRETDTVVNGLLAAYPELSAIGPDPLFPAVVHRLDTETSGIMLVARDQETYDFLRRQFGEKTVVKKYVALVCGAVKEIGHLEHRLMHSFSASHRMVVVAPSDAPAGQKTMLAMMNCSVQQRLARHTLLEVTMLTGVTHQIRCQLAFVGHPLAGDALYGSAESDAGYTGRLFLHAESIVFPDAATGELRSFRSELPADLATGLRRLGG